ncbi:hypothetical protein EDD86DRAFT_180396, partial [Gorgonomyces haynaldii]
LLSSEDLDVLWETLCQVSILQDNQRRMNYEQYRKASAKLPERFQVFFSPSLFLQMHKDTLGTVSVLQFFNYVLRKAAGWQARLELSSYATASGHLSEQELQDFIKDNADHFNLQGMSSSFQSKFYVCICLRKFMFFLDPSRKGKVSILSLLNSRILNEFCELRDQNLPENVLRNNWFSSFSALRTYGHFLNLDLNRNGMLSQDELIKYKNDSFTQLFVERIFQTTQTYDGEMDFTGFLDFVLAVENPSLPESIAYLFKAFDFGLGFMNEYVLRLFLNEIMIRLKENNLEPVPIEDVLYEIFDMAGVANRDKITLK